MISKLTLDLNTILFSSFLQRFKTRKNNIKLETSFVELIINTVKKNTKEIFNIFNLLNINKIM
jgi:hypothetical protein